MKFCKKCQIDTERSVRGECKPCIKLRGAARYAANPKRYCENYAEWRMSNKDKIKSKNAAWYLSNKEKSNKTKAIWNENNKEQKKKTSDDWYAANPGLYRIYSHNKKARKIKNGGLLSKGLTEKLFKLQRGKCPCCNQLLGDNFHLDHIVPLALGGPNIDSNMQLLRQRCNNQKYIKHPVDFMQSRGFLL